MCRGVTCQNGGTCVGSDAGLAACDCAASFIGGECTGSCASSTLAVAACNTLVAPAQWYGLGAGNPLQAPCQRAVRLELADPSGELLAAEANVYLASAYPLTPALRSPPMTDTDGDGVFEVDMLLEAGQIWLFDFAVAWRGRPAGVAVSTRHTIDPTTRLNVLTTSPCTVPQQFACASLFGQGDISLTGSAAAGPWFGFALVEPRVVTELRYRSDWWNKRPATWELWASDDADLTPMSGARRVATGDGRRAPWECVTGEPCSEGVPDECCPAGRTQPQSVAAGAHIAKWEVHPLAEPAAGRFFFFRVLTTEEPGNLELDGFELRGHDCFDQGGVFPVARCRPYGVGVDAGCAASQWCSPGGEREADRATPTCLPIGARAPGGSCARNCSSDPTQCQQVSQCQAGLVCFGAGFSLCVTACDPMNPPATCPTSLPVCHPATLGSATLPYGGCGPRPCPTVFGPGCDPGFWCGPRATSYSEPGQCFVNGPLRLGDACTRTAECPASSMCEGVCRALCRVNGTPSCTGATTCTVLDGDLAVCR